VNGLSVERAELREGDNISIGDVTVGFSLEEPRRVKQILARATIAALSILVVSLLLMGKKVERSSQVSYNSTDTEKPSGYREAGLPQGDQKQAEQLLRIGQEHLRDWRIKRGNAFRAQRRLNRQSHCFRGSQGKRILPKRDLRRPRRRWTRSSNTTDSLRKRLYRQEK
jgi:hypothetical protein